MVYSNNNVNFNGGIRYSTKDIENLAKYATGVALTNTTDLGLSEVLTSATSNMALQGGSWLWDNRKDLSGGFKALANGTNYATIRQASGFGGVLASNAGSALQKLIPNAEQLAKLSEGTQKLYMNAASVLSDANCTKETISKAHKILSKANAAAYAEKAASATGFFAKAKNVLGITKAGNAINNLAVKSPTFGKCLNTFKANGGSMMLIMEGGFEVISNVIPTFKQLGAKSGVKQLGKSAVKTAASVGGWVAGAALGTKLGALIGSIIPGAGTAVGAVVGGAIGSLCSLIGGSLGSRLAKKGAEAVVGKDELVLAQEKQAQQLAQAAQTDSTVLNQVAGAAAERLEAEGTGSDDAKVAFQSLSNLSQRQGTRSTSATGTTTSTTAQPQTTTNPFLAYTAGLNTATNFSKQDDLMAQSIGLRY